MPQNGIQTHYLNILNLTVHQRWWNKFLSEILLTWILLYHTGLIYRIAVCKISSILGYNWLGRLAFGQHESWAEGGVSSLCMANGVNKAC
jgi:hypothetical protein